MRGQLDEEEPQLLDTLTPGTSTQQAPVNMPPPLAAAASLPSPSPAPMSTPPPIAPPSQKLPGMPDSVTPDQIASYLGTQKNSLDKYGPEAQMNLQKSLNARRDSLGYRATDAGKGFADALMMGVAGAGNPNWQGQFENQENQYSKDQMDTLRGANEAQFKTTEAKMNLEKMDPNSQLSKTSQQAYGPLFQKLGYPPNKLQGMSAANIDSALQLMTAYGGKQVEAQIKQYELEIERMRLAAATGKNLSDEEIAKKRLKVDAAKEILDKSKNSRFMGIPIPGTADVSGKDVDAATKTLSGELGNGTTDQVMTPDVISYAKEHNITPEQALKIKKARGG